jgi:hypothetical protein
VVARGREAPRANASVIHFYAACGQGFKTRLLFTNTTPPAKSKKQKGPAFTAVAFMQQVLRPMVAALARQLGRRRYMVVLDHARQHTAKSTQKLIAELGVPILEHFPAQSWDIKIIECAWAQLANWFAGRRPRTAAGGRAVAQECWDEVGQGTNEKLSASVKDRMNKIVEGEGAWLTSYRHAY